MMSEHLPQTILDFWFHPSVQPKWFNSDAAFDQTLIERFEPIYEAALDGELSQWMETPEGALALIIVLDQFPLNMYRGQAKAFESETLVINYTKQALESKHDASLNSMQQMFVYMPLMHSENMDDQNLSVKLFRAQNIENSDAYALHHRSIVERFGRFPHRNEVLGRPSTPEEIEYLNSPEAFKG